MAAFNTRILQKNGRGTHDRFKFQLKLIDRLLEKYCDCTPQKAKPKKMRCHSFEDTSLRA